VRVFLSLDCLGSGTAPGENGGLLPGPDRDVPGEIPAGTVLRGTVHGAGTSDVAGGSRPSRAAPTFLPVVAPVPPRVALLMAGWHRTPPRPLHRRVEAVCPLFCKTAL